MRNKKITIANLNKVYNTLEDFIQLFNNFPKIAKANRKFVEFCLANPQTYYQLVLLQLLLVIFAAFVLVYHQNKCCKDYQ